MYADITSLASGTRLGAFAVVLALVVLGTAWPSMHRSEPPSSYSFQSAQYCAPNHDEGPGAPRVYCNDAA